LSNAIVASAAGARHRVAAERARVRARRPGHQAGARDGDAERQPRRDPLRDRHHVRLHAGELDREHLPRAPHARLHFVGDEQMPCFVVSSRSRCRNCSGATT
jgi:hypothetical protein